MYTLVEFHVMCRKQTGKNSYRAHVGFMYWLGPWRDSARTAEADLVDYLRLGLKARATFLDDAAILRQAPK